MTRYRSERGRGLVSAARERLRGIRRFHVGARKWAVLLVALSAGLVYANTLGNEFAYDDLHIVSENTTIQSLRDLPEAAAAPYWPNRYGQQLGLWRPVVTAVFAIQWSLWGENALAFHLVNLLGHAATSALVLILLARLMPLGAALTGGLLFAVHPVHVEAVANIVGLAEVLAGGFVLSACLLHLGSRECMGAGRILAIAGLYAAGFLTKESAVVLPVLLVILDAARRDLGWRQLPEYVRRRGLLFGVLGLVATAVLVARFAVLGSLASPFAPLGGQLLEEIPRIWTVAAIWPHYVRLLFFPRDLVADYAPEVVPILFGWHPQNVVGVSVAFLFLGIALLAWRTPALDGRTVTPRLAGLGILWFTVAVAPVSNVLFLSGMLLAERTLYLPSVGLAMLCGWVVWFLGERRRAVAWAVLVPTVALLAVRTWTRNPTWKDNETVFETLLSEHPESGRARWVLGDVLFSQGRVSEALYEYRAAVGILGAHYSLQVEIAKRLMSAGRLGGAELLLRQAWKSRPELPAAPLVLSVLYSNQGRWIEVEEPVREALRLDPRLALAHHLLATSLTSQGRYTEAVGSRLGAINNGEGDHWQQWFWLADLHARIGDYDAAMAALDSARARVMSASEHLAVDSLARTMNRQGRIP